MKPHPSLSRAGSFAEDRGHLGEHVLDGERARHAIGEPRQHLVGGSALAIHDAVGESRRPIPHWIEGQSDHGGSQDRQERVVCGADGRPDPDHNGYVDGREEGRQHAVDDGLVDHHVDLVQAVLQDGDADGRPEEHEGQAPEHRKGLCIREDRRDGRGEDEHRSCREPLELQPFVPDRSPEPCHERRQGDRE